MSITLIILAGFTSMSAIGAVIGCLSHQEATKQAAARETWRTIAHRGGVTERSPWHSSTSSYNAPGVVRIYPRSQQPEASVRPERPAPVSVKNPTDESDSADSETPELPLELADEPNETEKRIVLKHIEDGLSQSKTILTVWGIKSGGSAKYQSARSRYLHYKEALVNV